MATALVAGRTGQSVRALARTSAASDMHSMFFERPDLDLTRPRTMDKAIGKCVPHIILNAAARETIIV